jgi:CO dehydrogenase/acetyl-CoA synthase delta subunit
MTSCPPPIDLEALRREAESCEGDRVVVSRAWLRRVYEELSAARAAEAALGRVFGRRSA